MSPSTASSTQSSPGLGSLSRLPPEIRDQIWQQVLLQRLRSSAFYLYGRFRQISRHISEEISSSFYRGRSLRISIDYPGEGFGRWPSEFAIKDQSGFTVRQFEPSFLRHSLFGWTDKESEEIISEFRKIPLYYLQAISIDIAAPKPEDPGEAVQSWNKIVFIMNLLSGLELPKLELRFIEQTERSWSSNNKLHHSVPGYEGADYDSDLEMLMKPFLRLRGLPLLNIHTDGITLDGVSRLTIEDLNRKTASHVAFGKGKDSETFVLDDEEIQEAENAVSCWLDFQLGDLAGRSAALLRVEQYASFTSKLLWTMHERMHNSDLVGPQFSQASIALFDRPEAVYAFNPLGPWRVRVPQSLREERRHPNPDAYDSDDERWHYSPAERQGDSDKYPFVGYRQEEWLNEYRHHGIPRCSTAEWIRKFKENHIIEREQTWPWHAILDESEGEGEEEDSG